MNRVSKLTTERISDERVTLEGVGECRQEMEQECDRLIHGLWEEMELQRSGSRPRPAVAIRRDQLPSRFSLGSRVTAFKRPPRQRGHRP